MSGRGRESHAINELAKRVAKRWPDYDLRKGVANVIASQFYQRYDPVLFGVIQGEINFLNRPRNRQLVVAERYARDLEAELRGLAVTPEQGAAVAKVTAAIAAIDAADNPSWARLRATIKAIQVAKTGADVTQIPIPPALQGAVDRSLASCEEIFAKCKNVVDKAIASFLLQNPFDLSPTDAEKWQRVVCDFPNPSFERLVPFFTPIQVDFLVCRRRLTPEQAGFLYDRFQGSPLGDRLAVQSLDQLDDIKTAADELDSDGLLLTEAQLRLLAPPNTGLVQTANLEKMTIGQIAALLDGVDLPAPPIDPTPRYDQLKAVIENEVKEHPQFITQEIAGVILPHYEVLPPTTNPETHAFLHTRSLDHTQVLSALEIPVPRPGATRLFRVDALSYEQVVGLTENDMLHNLDQDLIGEEFHQHVTRLLEQRPHAPEALFSSQNDTSYYLRRYLNAEHIANLSDADFSEFLQRPDGFPTDLSAAQADVVLRRLQSLPDRSVIDPSDLNTRQQIIDIANRSPEPYKSNLQLLATEVPLTHFRQIQALDTQGCPVSVQQMRELIDLIAATPVGAHVPDGLARAFRALDPHGFSEGQRQEFVNRLDAAGLNRGLLGCLTPEQIDYLIATRLWNPASYLAVMNVPHWTTQQKQWLQQQIDAQANLDEDAINAPDADGLPTITKNQLRALSVAQLQQLKPGTINKMNVAQLTGLACNQNLTPAAAGTRAAYSLNTSQMASFHHCLAQSLQTGSVGISEARELVGDSVLMYDPRLQGLRAQTQTQALSVEELRERFNDRFGRFEPFDPGHLSREQMQGLTVFDYLESQKNGRLFHRAKYLMQQDGRPEFTGSMTSLMTLCMKPQHVERLEDEQLRVLMGVWGQAHRRDPEFRIGETQRVALVSRLSRCQLDRNPDFMRLVQSVAAMVPEKQAEIMALTKKAAGGIGAGLAMTAVDVTQVGANGKCVLSIPQLDGLLENIDGYEAVFQALDPNQMTPEQQQRFCDEVDEDLYPAQNYRSKILPLLTSQQIEFLVASRELSINSAAVLLGDLTARMATIPPGLQLQATALAQLDQAMINQVNQTDEPLLSLQQLKNLPRGQIALLKPALVAKMSVSQLVALRANNDIHRVNVNPPAALVQGADDAAIAEHHLQTQLHALKTAAEQKLSQLIQEGQLTKLQLHALQNRNPPLWIRVPSFDMGEVRGILQGATVPGPNRIYYISREQLNQLTVRDYNQANPAYQRDLLVRAKQLAESDAKQADIKPTSLMALFLTPDTIKTWDKTALASLTTTWSQAQRMIQQGEMPAGVMTPDKQQALLNQHRQQLRGQSSLALYRAIGPSWGTPLVDPITPAQIGLLRADEFTASMRFWVVHGVALDDQQQIALARRLQNTFVDWSSDLARLPGLSGELKVLQKPVPDLDKNDIHVDDRCCLSLLQIKQLIENYDLKEDEFQALDPKRMSSEQKRIFLMEVVTALSDPGSDIHEVLTEEQINLLAESRFLGTDGARRLHDDSPVVDNNSPLGKLLAQQANDEVVDMLPRVSNALIKSDDGRSHPVLTAHQLRDLGTCEGLKPDTIRLMNVAQLIGLAQNAQMNNLSDGRLDRQRDALQNRVTQLVKVGQLTTGDARALSREPVIQSSDAQLLLHTPSLGPVAVQRLLDGSESDPDFNPKELSAAQLASVDWSQVAEDRQDVLRRRHRYVNHAATVKDAFQLGKERTLDDEGSLDAYSDFRLAVLRVARYEGHVSIDEFVEKSANKATLERLLQPRCALQIHRICLAAERSESTDKTYYQQLREILCNPTVKVADGTNEDRERLIDPLEIDKDTDVPQVAQLITDSLPDLNQQAFLSIDNKPDLYATLEVLRGAGLKPQDLSFDTVDGKKDKCLVNLPAFVRAYKLSDDGKDFVARPSDEGDNLSSDQVKQQCKDFAEKSKDAGLKTNLLQKAKQNSDTLGLIIESEQIKLAKDAYEKSLKEDKDKYVNEAQRQAEEVKRIRDSIQPLQFNAMRATSVNMEDPADMTSWVEEMLNWMFGLVENCGKMYRAGRRGNTVRALRRIANVLDANPNLSATDREHLRLIYECHKARYSSDVDARHSSYVQKRRDLESFYRQNYGGSLPERGTIDRKKLWTVAGTYISPPADNLMDAMRIRVRSDADKAVLPENHQKSREKRNKDKREGEKRYEGFVAQHLDQLWSAISGEEEQHGEGQVKLIQDLKQDLCLLADNDASTIANLHTVLGQNIKRINQAVVPQPGGKVKNGKIAVSQPEMDSLQRLLKRAKSLQPYCAKSSKAHLKDIGAKCYDQMRSASTSPSVTLHGGPGMPPTSAPAPTSGRKSPRSGSPRLGS